MIESVCLKAEMMAQVMYSAYLMAETKESLTEKDFRYVCQKA